MPPLENKQSYKVFVAKHLKSPHVADRDNDDRPIVWPEDELDIDMTTMGSDCESSSREGDDSMFFAAVNLNLKVDIYSLLLVRLVGMWEAGVASSIIQITHGALLYFVVLSLQLAISAFLLLSTERLEHPLSHEVFEKNYNMTLGESATYLDDAVRLGNSTLPFAMAEHDGQGGVLRDICAKHLSVRYFQFYYIMVFVWLAVMMGEIKEAVWWTIGLAGVRSKYDDSEDLTEYDEHNKQTTIVHLSCWQKILLLILIPALRFIVICIVTIAGCQFLVLQSSMFIVVLKTLCMRFVLQIDQLALKSLASDGAIRKLRATLVHTRWGQPKPGSLSHLY